MTPVIDSHVHVFREGSEPFPGDAPVENLLAKMESHGVARAVLVGLSRHDEYVTECLRADPDRFRAILVQDPAQPDSIDAIRRRVEGAGAHGVRVFD
ncbi:MAG: L-fuconolactonase, partial [Gaiellaceae bacterium]|nr:L-fuconolactonase [Gaiellaceae bacterium]